MTEKINQLKKLLEQPKQISIVIHRNPDGDAIGSGLALRKFLINKGHRVDLISPNPVPDYLRWMPGTKDIIVYDDEPEKVSEILNNSELIFTLDFNDLSRVGTLLEEVLKKLDDKTFVMIDHHLNPKDYAKFTFSDDKKSSTSEMVYDFITELGSKNDIDKDMATNLFTGIMTDTGSFKFPNTTSHTMRVAGELMDKGAENNKIQVKIYDSFSRNKMKLLGKTINKMIFLPEYKTAYMVLTKNNLKKYKYRKGDTEGFVNYGLALKAANFAVLFLENEDGTVRISFRSKGDFPANEFAKRYFNGGGHLNAAGGRTNENIETAVEKFLEKLPEFYKDYTNNNV